MKILNTTSVYLFVAITFAGCAAKTDDSSANATLGTNESLLVSDNEDVAKTDETAEEGIEAPLSGSQPSDPGTPPDAADGNATATTVKANAGKWFTPAGCLTTTLSGNVATHVFAGCTGPYGFVKFNGTITSTYTRSAGTLTITHEANNFEANGATWSGKRVVTYTKSGAITTRVRTGSWNGKTENGKDFTHEANFTVTWDSEKKCVTRDGSAKTSIESREFSRVIKGYKRCSIGNLGCPSGGTIVLERTKGDKTASLTLQFLGGRDYSVKTLPAGGSVMRLLVCKEN